MICYFWDLLGVKTHISGRFSLDEAASTLPFSAFLEAVLGVKTEESGTVAFWGRSRLYGSWSFSKAELECSLGCLRDFIMF